VLIPKSSDFLLDLYRSLAHQESEKISKIHHKSKTYTQRIDIVNINKV